MCIRDSLGCVQVREPTDCLEDPDWSAFIRVDDTALADTRARADALRAALELLNRYAPSKGGLFSPRPEITEGQLFDDQARREALDAAERITGHEARINAIYAEQSKLCLLYTSWGCGWTGRRTSSDPPPVWRTARAGAVRRWR